MDARSDRKQRTLSDYPISLRQTARAVFGERCNQDGRNTTTALAVPDASGPSKPRK